jgi:hypothetical protein
MGVWEGALTESDYRLLFVIISVVVTVKC